MRSPPLLFLMPPTASKESTIVTSILKALRERGAFAEKMHGGVYQRRGLPDIFGCLRGKAFGIEVKRPGQKTTPLQIEVLRGMGEAGAIVGIAYSVKDALDILTLE